MLPPSLRTQQRARCIFPAQSFIRHCTSDSASLRRHILLASQLDPALCCHRRAFRVEGRPRRRVVFLRHFRRLRPPARSVTARPPPTPCSSPLHCTPSTFNPNSFLPPLRFHTHPTIRPTFTDGPRLHGLPLTYGALPWPSMYTFLYYNRNVKLSFTRA